MNVNLNLSLNKPQPPAWYLQPVKDDNTYLYATGAGNSRQEAVNEALGFIASKVNVTVNSSFETSKGIFENGGHSDSYKQLRKKTSSKTQNINFADYNVIKEKNTGGKWYVLIRINKYKNAKLIYFKAVNDIEDIKHRLNLKDKIKILKTYPELIKKIKKDIFSLYSAQSLGNIKNINRTIQQAINLKNRLEQKLNTVGIYIITGDYKTAQAAKDVLSELNIPVSKNGIRLYLSLRQQNRKIGSYYITTISLNAALKDRTSVNFSIKCGGKSVTGSENAKSFAIQDCKEKLKNKLAEFFKKSRY
jgi:hypothetical protein